ncbi:hypothetical protein JM84_2343 [Dokdonia sp. Hel_I_63]|jgi:hypothetical protein|uniref:hypothetical protein n=1 Tax=unclassified Dokdonia TaxID=2615033 RepID=UPI00020A734A|nr:MULTISPECIES: hypothetical protein [unclassified Dokdonia]AEE20318.1 hypothetical protein Krodi_2340 [Dokdonia sp. 4H-3-7-5]TVZ23419.1 hypothetical protein JM84_2343 [Dokdonia sp. Hel_I_63]
MKHLFQLLLLGLTMSSYAQVWSVELRPTLHIPTREVANQKLRIGNGLELTGVLSIGKRTDLYGGLIWNRFDTDEGFEESDIEFIQKGFLFGGMVSFSILESQKNPFYVRAGLTLMTVDTERTEGNFIIKTDPAIGTHLGLGMKIISLGNWHVLPEVRYGNSSHRYQEAGEYRHISFGNISITAALRRSF